MSTTAELAELHDLVGGLRRCVTALKARFGDNPATRRIVIDADRILTDIELLDTDVSELDLNGPPYRNPARKSPSPTPSTIANFGAMSTMRVSEVTGTEQPSPQKKGAVLCVPFNEITREEDHIR